MAHCYDRSMKSCLALGLVWTLLAISTPSARAQAAEKPTDTTAAKAAQNESVPPDVQAERLRQADRKAQEELAAKEPSADRTATASKPAADAIRDQRVNILQLLTKGGPVMVPIGILSVIAVAFALDRLLGLRRAKVVPRRFVRGLKKLAAQKEGFDPRQVYRLCQQYPSASATVVRSMLMKLGRPNVEIQQAMNDARDREAGRLYANVRWLSLAAGVGPLLGLLGTVQGMIHSFFVTANLPTGANRAEYLASGIYIALVTTFAGLSVAIPSAILAHIFEGRIQNLFRDLDDALQKLLPQLERYEGRLQVTHDQLEARLAGTAKAVPATSEPRRPAPATNPPASAPK